LYLPTSIVYIKIYLLNFLERFVTIGLKSFLVIYFIKILNLDYQTAAAILSIFFFWEYLFSIINGKYIDKYSNDKKAMALGFLLSSCASILFFSSQTYLIYLSIALFNISAAMIKPAIPHFLKNIIRYSKKKRYDQRFLIIHMLTNMAAIISPLVLGYFLSVSNSQYIAIVLATISIVGTITGGSTLKHSDFKHIKNDCYFILFILISFLLIYISFLYQEIFVFLSLAIILFIFNKFLHFYRDTKPSEKANLNKILLTLVFFFIYFLINIQKLSALSIIIEDFVNRSVHGFEIPTPWFISIISIFVVIFSYIKSRSKKELSTIQQLFFGARLEMILYILLSAILFSFSEIPLFVIILFYAGFSLSEIHISPITISYIAQKTPAKPSNIYFGLAPASAALASYLNIFLSKYAFFNNEDLLHNFGIFLIVAAITLAAILFFFRKFKL